jgi:hypothetical protein
MDDGRGRICLLVDGWLAWVKTGSKLLYTFSSATMTACAVGILHGKRSYFEFLLVVLDCVCAAGRPPRLCTLRTLHDRFGLP